MGLERVTPDAEGQGELLPAYPEGQAKKFDEAVERWIKEGVLIPWKKEVMSRMLPQMAVVQPTKGGLGDEFCAENHGDRAQIHPGKVNSIRRSINFYIDDMLVDEAVVPIIEVMRGTSG